MRVQQVSSKTIVAHVVVYLLYYAACCYLFYMQVLNVFESDLGKQLELALDPEYNYYSLIGLLLSSSYSLGGYYGVAAILALFEPITMALTEYLLLKLIPQIKPSALLALTVVLTFAIALFVPFLNEYVYRGTSSGNKWHNPTYTCMRVFALGAVIFYLRIIGRMDSNAHWQDYVAFPVCVLLATVFKPSFYTIFAPAVFVMCVIDLVRDRSTVKRSLILGVMLALPLAVVASQYNALFASERSGGIGIGFALVWSHYNDNVPVAMLQSYAFPLLVLAGCWRQLKSDNNYSLAWIMFLIGLAEYLVLYETGFRIWHGNFGWGLSFGAFYLMIASVVALVNTHRPICEAWLFEHSKAERREALSHIPPSTKAYVYLSAAILAYHALSGLVLFGAMLFGKYYNTLHWPW